MRRNLPNLPIEKLFDAIDITDEAVEMTQEHFITPTDELPAFLYMYWADDPNVAVRLINTSMLRRNSDDCDRVGFARANHTDEYVFETGLKIALLRAAAKFVCSAN